MADLSERLSTFRREVHMNLAFGALADEELRVVDDQGEFPIVAALGEERLAVFLARVAKSGGYANVFVDLGDSVAMLPFIDASCAIGSEHAEDLASDDSRPGATATVGMFVAYLELKPNGVRLPARLDGERPFVPTPREVEFSPA